MLEKMSHIHLYVHFRAMGCFGLQIITYKEMCFQNVCVKIHTIEIQHCFKCIIIMLSDTENYIVDTEIYHKIPNLHKTFFDNMNNTKNY